MNVPSRLLLSLTATQEVDGLGRPTSQTDAKATSPSANGSRQLGHARRLTTDGSTQSRIDNQQNQQTSLTTGTNVTTLTYDNDGNLLTDDHGNTIAYDPWNHQSHYAGDNVPQGDLFYVYDGLGRLSFTLYSLQYYPGQVFAYDNQGRIIEERTWDGYTLERQNVYSGGWGSYVNAMIERDRFVDDDYPDDLFNRTPLATPERLYVQQDANANVTSVADTSGNVQERFVYDPYGRSTTLGSDWGNAPTNSAKIDWNYTFQGARFDADSQTYMMGFRRLSPTLGWTTAEPFMGNYVDGTNLY